jgi:endogenous inhibitor of DNA gyrase (YacG/DUF329 family)|tara:strand:- start:11 stop:199 length:189 start_codon:yes stop_codon:yes gene_type:complete
MPEIKCPQCGEKSEWNPDNPYRPFCSEQCKNLDFIAWAHGERHIPGDSQVSDIFSEDLEKFE